MIEERRKAAEAMLRFTVNIPALNNSPQLKEFFRVCAFPSLGVIWCLSLLPQSPPWVDSGISEHRSWIQTQSFVGW